MSDRFEGQDDLSSEQLVQRDQMDLEIVQIGKTLIKVLDKALPFEELMLKYPAVYRKPVHLVLASELQSYKSLMLVMKKSVKHLVDTIQGTTLLDDDCDLWTCIQNNRVPP